MQVNANGIDIHYEMHGPPGAPVVLLSHSLATDLRMWAPQAALAHDYRLLSYDTRGHGRSGVTPGDYTLELLAADALALVDALAIERVHWVGISMGGMVGQAFALANPERLAGIALCATLCEFPPDAAEAWQARVHTAGEQGMAALVEPTIERWFSPAFAGSGDATVQSVREMIRATPVQGYVACCRAIMGLDYTGRLADLRLPALVMVGEDDPSTPVSASQQIHGRIPGSRLRVIRGARHLCNIEKAGEFNAALAEFLAATT